jgi:conjugal transfer pilus assembly protein TraV
MKKFSFNFFNFLKPTAFLSFSRFLACSIFAFFVSFLSGCAGMGHQFDCNVSSGGKCAPMHNINKMADHGAFNDSQAHKGSTRNLIQMRYKKEYPLNSFDGRPIRSNESVQQIWIGPYEDVNGNYHEPSYLYTVVKNGSWVGEPVGVIQD